MKKLVCILAASILAACVLLCGCSVKQITVLQEDEFVVLIFDSGFNGKSLSEAMQDAKENEQIDYTVDKGMVISINGINNVGNKYWMLYTDDEEFSDTAWGEISYQDKIYGSATKGVSDLAVKDGKTYIWVYTELSY